ncbi:MAG: VTT domain-containing protein [Alphaproteobacteria bacterium]|nr:VTT domain-containing protein [Alphaproteobacteria bacterium]
MSTKESVFLQEGRTYWRAGHANRAAVLVDAAAYFGVLRNALMRARHSIFVLGWDIDSRVELIGEDPEQDDGAPRRLRDLLIHLVQNRPGLQVYLLLWDYSILYALEREPLPSINLAWATPRRINVCLDSALPLGASHHQKMVVVDDAIAFCGGIDLAIRRWDTCEHRPNHPSRRDPDGKPYDPFHDIQMCVDGEAAAIMADLARERWRNATDKHLPKTNSAGDLWPTDLAPDLTNVEVALARTVPALDGAPPIREVESLYLTAIDQAKRFIYIENQFLTSYVIAERLAERLADTPELEVLLISRRDHHGWLEARSMQAGRVNFMRQLHDAGVGDRVRLVHPAVLEEKTEHPVTVHAKLMIVDDKFLRVGSSNLNNRSMGVDTEYDLAVEASSSEQRRSIAGVLNRLLGEHLGVSAAVVAESREANGSLFQTLDAHSGGPRQLLPVQDPDDFSDTVTQAIGTVGDPERPIQASKFVGDMFGGKPVKRRLQHLWPAVLIGMAVLAFALIWQVTPVSQLADPDTLRTHVSALSASPWAPLIVPCLYMIGALIAFPITVMIAVTAMVFDPLPALAYAGTGSLIGASATYQLGALAGHKVLRRIMGRRLHRISRALAKKGLLSVMTIRMVPVAPFTLVNLVSGVSHIRFADFFLGTILGMAPGILVMTALGNQLAKVLADPSPAEIALLALVLCIWIGLSAGLQVVVSRMRS